jgi:hypothetical protein
LSRACLVTSSSFWLKILTMVLSFEIAMMIVLTAISAALELGSRVLEMLCHFARTSSPVSQGTIGFEPKVHTVIWDYELLH